jgi:hypothetical protein
MFAAPSPEAGFSSAATHRASSPPWRRGRRRSGRARRAPRPRTAPAAFVGSSFGVCPYWFGDHRPPDLAVALLVLVAGVLELLGDLVLLLVEVVAR